MAELSPFTIQVEMVPKIHPIDGGELARYLVEAVESRGIGVDGAVWTAETENALHRAVDRAIKVFGLVKAFPSESDGNPPGIPTGPPDAEPPVVTHLIQFPDGKLYRCPRDGQLHTTNYMPCTLCVPEPIDRITTELKSFPLGSEGIQPYCWCFDQIESFDHPHRWTPRDGCPVDRPPSKADRNRVLADLVSNTPCWCPAYGSTASGQPSEPHPWSPISHCPQAAPRVGQEEPLPEQWSRAWYDQLETELGHVLNRRNVDGALNRPEWEIARRLMIEVAKMRREVTR